MSLYTEPPRRVVPGYGTIQHSRPALLARRPAHRPAWTPLFDRAAVVVTDGGSLAAHASLVARAYGIPAVVGTGEATRRLRNGQSVTVDGGAGTVELGR